MWLNNSKYLHVLLVALMSSTGLVVCEVIASSIQVCYEYKTFKRSWLSDKM